MTEAYYRLTDKPDSGAVMVEDILQPHRHWTLRRTQGEKTGLRVKVSSAVNFAKRGKGLGGTNQTGAAARPIPVPHIFVGLALGQKERDAVARLGQTLALCDELIGRGMLGGGIVRRDDIASARLQNAVLWRGEQEPSAGPQAGEFHGMREIPMLLVTISAAQPARGGGGFRDARSFGAPITASSRSSATGRAASAQTQLHVARLGRKSSIIMGSC